MADVKLLRAICVASNILPVKVTDIFWNLPNLTGDSVLIYSLGVKSDYYFILRIEVARTNSGVVLFADHEYYYEMIIKNIFRE